jgi:predicted amidohydrolase
MKLALVQMNSSGDRDANVARACAFVDRAVAEAGADLVVLPEFFNNVYFAQYWDGAMTDWAERDDGPTMSAVRERARRHSIHVLATIFEEDGPGVYYDTAILVGPEGDVLGKYRKVQPAAVQSLEKIFFRFGSHFPVFRVGPWRIGVNICYDTLFPESARCTALNGADVILVPFAAPPQVLWRDLMRTRAFDNGVYFAPCNKVGTEGDWTFGGQSMIVSPLGEVIADVDGEAEGIVAAELDREEVFRARRRYPMFRDRRPDLYHPITTATEDLPGSR